MKKLELWKIFGENIQIRKLGTFAKQITVSKEFLSFQKFFFFKFKISSFPHNKSYDHKIHRQGSLWPKLKIGRWKIEKKIYINFVDFWWFW
jgi:hypothetical protein